MIDDDDYSRDWYYSAPNDTGCGGLTQTGAGDNATGGDGESPRLVFAWSWPCLPSECLP